MVLEHFTSPSPKLKTKWWVLLSLLLLILTIQANIGWLNPRPGFEPLVKFSEKIPLLWQYNTDATEEFFTAQTFPASLKAVPTRISRPTYPLFARLFRVIVEMATPLSTPASTAVGYIGLKVLVYFIYCWLFLKLLLRWVDEHTALLALVLSLFHPLAITFIGTYQTTELQFITPVIVTFLFLDLSRAYTLKKNFLYSLLVGVLMLAKPDYAIYVAVLLFALYKREFKAAGFSFLAQLIPMGLWLLFLKLYGVPYFNNEAVNYGQGVWLYQDFIFQSPSEMLKTVGDSLTQFFKLFWEFYGMWIFIALGGLAYRLQKKKREHEIWVFVFLLLFATWFQSFAAQRYVDYMSADLEFVVFGLAATLIFAFLPSRLKKKPSLVLGVIGGLWLGFNVTSMVHLPWIPPSAQHLYSEEELGEVRSYLERYPHTNIEFLNEKISTRVALTQSYVGDATIFHDLNDVPVVETDGCRTYHFESLYAITEGTLVMDDPSALKEVSFSNDQAEWFPVPLQKEVTVDYTMHRQGFHVMQIDPANVSTSWGGYSYTLYVDQQRLVGETMGTNYAYDFVLYEDGVPLSHNADLQTVINEGNGQYSIRDDGLLAFSTSDNSDPRTNGRTYKASYTNYSSFAEPLGRRDYFLRFCPQDANDFSFEDSLQILTHFQYNRAIWPELIRMSESMPQILLGPQEKD